MMESQPVPTTNPFVEINERTNEAFANLAEGHIFTEKFALYFIIAIVKKNLVVIYQGTEGNLIPICYPSKEAVVKKFQWTGQSGYWCTFLKSDKDFSDKLLNQ